MLRKIISRTSQVISVGVGTSLGVGIYALYVDAPEADYTPDGTFQPKPKQFPEYVKIVPRALDFAAFAIGKVYLGTWNDFTCSGQGKLLQAVKRRPSRQGLITVANHTATVDDPAVLQCLLPWSVILNPLRSRWSMISQEYGYEKGQFLATMFYASQTLPIKRGAGVDQMFLKELYDKLQEGLWVHVFPEGTIEQTGELGGRPVCRRGDIGRLKWGTAKLIARADITPQVIPIYHVGMEKIMPQDKDRSLKNALPKTGQRVHAVVGNPINFDDLIAEYRAKQFVREDWNSSEEERQMFSKITLRIEEALLKLEAQAYRELEESKKTRLQQSADRHRLRLQSQK